MDFSAFMTLVLEKGLFAALFVVAFFFILKENAKREENQGKLFLKLSDSLEKAKDSIIIIENKFERIDNNTADFSKDLSEIRYRIEVSLDMLLKNKAHRDYHEEEDSRQGRR